MGIVIYVSGEGSIDGDITEKKLADIKAISNNWDFPAFAVSKKGCGFEFAESMMEGCNPYTDGILNPLDKLIDYAKKENLVVDGEFAITSDWSDYDNIEIIISENTLSTANSEIVNADTEELVNELQKRNVPGTGYKVIYVCYLTQSGVQKQFAFINKATDNICISDTNTAINKELHMPLIHVAFFDSKEKALEDAKMFCRLDCIFDKTEKGQEDQ